MLGDASSARTAVFGLVGLSRVATMTSAERGCSSVCGVLLSSFGALFLLVPEVVVLRLTDTAEWSGDCCDEREDWRWVMPAALAGFAAATFIVAVVFSRFHHDVVRIFEARERLGNGGLLLDVDARGEFAKRHPSLAVNIPLAELAVRAHELGSTKRSIVVYAHRFRDGMKAVHLLRSLGFEDVYDAAGVRVEERLGAAATHAEAARARREQERGVPPDIDLAPSVR